MNTKTVKGPGPGWYWSREGADVAVNQARDRVEKRYVMEQMARQCEIGEALVAYWMKHETSTPEATAFFASCRECFAEGVPAGYLYTAREQWDTKDWRGKKGQIPTPPQLLEQALRGLPVNALLSGNRIDPEKS